MHGAALHRFELNGKRYAIDPETCFCFECDEICWDVLALYPHETISRIVHELKQKHSEREVYEVVGELEWLRRTAETLRNRAGTEAADGRTSRRNLRGGARAGKNGMVSQTP